MSILIGAVFAWIAPVRAGGILRVCMETPEEVSWERPAKDCIKAREFQ